MSQLGIQTFPQQPYLQTFANPFSFGGYGSSPLGIGQASSPVQQIAQWLQIVPQQLQHVQQLQQVQAQYLQQLLQFLPQQLQQLQQLIQLVPHQSQQQGLPFGAGIAGPLTFGLSPQTYAGQSAGHVM